MKKKTILSVRDKAARLARKTLRAIKAGLFTEPHPYKFRDPVFESLEEFTRNLIYFVFVVGTVLILIWANDGGLTP